MKILLSILLLLTTACISSQSSEEKICDCIQQFREDKAQSLFGKELSDLSESELQEIKDLIPFRIAESLPE